MQRLNSRFRDGHASNDLEEAGVILRQFDSTEDYSAPWRGCPHGKKVPEGAGNDCAIFGGRFSASIVNAALVKPSKIGPDKIALYAKESGVVYNPQATLLNCVYGGDGGTRRYPNDGCGPEKLFCDPGRSARDGWCDGKPHTPDRLADILRYQLAAAYNEVVINTAYISSHLPDAVDAFFYVAGAPETLRRHAVEAHAHFLAAYPELSAADHPLLCLVQTDLERPFREARLCGT